MALVKERGKLFLKGEVVTGTSRAGNPWANQQIVVEVYGSNNFVKKVAAKTNKVDLLNKIQEIPEGREVEIQYSVSAREYNGKWYTDVDLSSIDLVRFDSASAPSPAPRPAAPAPTQINYSAADLDPAEHKDDFPF